MFVWPIGFLGGIATTTSLSQLPPIWFVFLLLLLSITVYIAPIRKDFYGLQVVISGTLLAIAWSCYQAHKIVVPLPENYIKHSTRVTGTIASIPEFTYKRVQFEYLVDSMGHQACKPIRILLAQYNYGNQSQLPVKIGERWQFTIRLKKARGFWNAGSFDYEGFLIQKGILWKGYIIEKNPSKRSKTPQSFTVAQKIDDHFTYKKYFYTAQDVIYQIRQHIRENIHHNIRCQSHVGLLNAIVTGFRESITQAQWQVMKATGTNHLFSISGLHVSFVGSIFYALVNVFWRYTGRLALYLPAQQAAYFSAWLSAVSYSLLSGFALPVQRAIIMATVFTLTLLKRRVFSMWRGWCIALTLILFFEPFVILSESFWLSFGTVAIIFYSLGKRLYLPMHMSVMQRWWFKWGHIHWVINIGLLPFTLFFFQQIAVWGFFANLIAIPWMGFIILPNTLLGALLSSIYPSLGSVLLWIGEQAMHVLWFYLSCIAQLQFANSTMVIANSWVLLSLACSVFIHLSPKGLPTRHYLTFLFLLPLFLCQPVKPLQGEIWLTLLDVGQGLAAIVRTREHLLIYDTGPRLGPEFDTGKVVLIPYLKNFNLQKIDKLIISHADNDHSGGAQSLLENVPVHSILASQPKQLHHPLAKLGHAGQAWEWDNVQFRILHPPLQSAFKSKNDNSCVLHISNGTHSILLPGDIHRKAEIQLLKAYPNVKSTVLVAPHHGSKTSSSLPFVRAVQPDYVLFPVGYQNRFRFPHTIVLKRYAQHGSQMYSTAKEGAITIKLGTVPKKIELSCYARTKARFWRNVF